MARKAFAILVLIALALAGVQALALARARSELGEAAWFAAKAVASRVRVERAYAVDQTCGDKPSQPAVLTLDRLPTAKEIVAQVAPGCRYAGARFAGLRFVPPQGAELTALQALGLPGADVESVRVERDEGAARATVTVAARRRALLLTVRVTGRAVFTPDKGPEALAREFVDSGVAQRAADLALGGSAVVEETVTTDSSAASTASAGSAAPPPGSKEARAAEIAAYFKALQAGTWKGNGLAYVVALCSDHDVAAMVMQQTGFKTLEEDLCNGPGGGIKGPDLSGFTDGAGPSNWRDKP